MKKVSIKEFNKKSLSLIFGGLIIAAILALLVYQAGSIKGQNTLSDSTFGNQKIGTESTLYMTFPDTMDKKSVAENIELPENLEGEMEWKDKTLVFNPSTELKEGEDYKFRVNRFAEYASGKPINKDLEFSFEVAGDPQVSSRIPNPEAVNIDADSKIHIVFDRPMIPLSAVQGSGAKKYENWPVTIKPALKGRWRWLGTSAVEFAPTDKMKLATKYTVSVPKGIQSIIGDKTSEDFSWEFTTKRPKIVSVNPRNNYLQAGPDTEIIVTFNNEVNLKSVEDHVVLSEVLEDNGFSDIPLRASYTKIEDEDLTENSLKSVTLTPKKILKLKASYNVKISSDIKGLEGNLGSEDERSLNFSTVGDLGVEGRFVNNNHVSLIFTNPIDNESIAGNVSISPEVEGWDELMEEIKVRGGGNQLNIYKYFKPSTKYTITVNKKLKDKYGQTLATPSTFEFETNKLEPKLEVHSETMFGIFEANKAPAYPIEVVNVSEINIEFARIPFDEFLNIKKNNNDYGRSIEENLSKHIGYKKITLHPKNELNEWETLYFELEKELGRKLIPGIYGIKISAPEYVYDWGKRKGDKIITSHFFSTTRTALTMKYSGNKALVWAIDMKTGKPTEDASIRFYNLNAEVKIEGKTDKNGIFETEIDLAELNANTQYGVPEFWVTSTKGNDFSLLGSYWNEGLDSWNFGIPSNFHSLRSNDYTLDSFIYTERNAYRPGDTVNFKGILRLRDENGAISIPSNKKVEVYITDAKSNEIFKKNLTVNEFGSFDGQIPIEEKAPLGRYNISTTLLPDESISANYGNHSFHVLAYRKPEYKVEVNPLKENYFSKDDIEFDVQGSYFFGAPMSDAKIEWSAYSADYFFNRYTDGWYSFSLDGTWCWWECQESLETITNGEGELDSNGKFKVAFPYDLNDKSTGQVVTLSATITDSNNQTVTNRESVPVHKADIYVGLQAEDYAVAPNEEARIKVITLNPDGSTIANKKVTLSLFSREWNTIKKKSVDGRFYYENEPKDTLVRKTSVITNEDGKTTAKILIEEGGQYRIVAEAKDGKNRVSKAGATVYGFSSTYVNWPRKNNDRIEMIVDKPEYAVGDIAKILVKSPYQGSGVKALVTVERENVLTTELIDIVSNAQSIEVPITEDLIPNAYVSVVIIKPRDGDTFDENGNDTGKPAFKIGYAKLKVETERKLLNVDISTDKEKYGPGEEVKVSIKTTNYLGEPQKSEVSLGVVDMSVQTLLGFKMPDLIKEFYSDRALGVRTAELLTHLLESFKPGSKGGGGGPEDRVRGTFKDTAYWNPNITTNENGEANLSFTLPDNLTTWQLLGIAQTKDHNYGANTHEIIETKNVILRPVRPRFAVIDDEIKLGAIVHNFMDENTSFNVTLKGSGFTNTGESTQKVTLKPDEHKKLIFPVKVNKTEELTFDFKAESPEASDHIIEKIPVYIFGSPQSVATSGVVDKEAIEKLYIPNADEAKDGTITTILSPSIASYIPKGLEYLVQYPYGCAEQTVSSFLPNVALKSLQNFDAFNVVSGEELETNIIAGLEKLYTYQRGGGGFGYWQGSKRSYPHLSAYIVFALDKTKKAGFFVDQNVIDRANIYLETILRTEFEDNYISPATRAYILFVQSETGRTDINLLDNLYEKRNELPLFAKAYLAMSYNSSSLKAKELVKEMMNEVKIDSRGAHFEESNQRRWRYNMNTNNKTTALVLQAIIKIDPNNDLTPKIVRHLLASREDGHWDTTQSTVASIFTLIDYLNLTNELDGDFVAKLNVNGDLKQSEKFNKDNILTKKEVVLAFSELNEDAYNPVKISKEGEGKLYYDMTMDYLLTLDELPATEQGIGIHREMTPVKSDSNDIKTNDVYKVKLTITASEDRHFVAVSSPLPAGFEAIDFKLKISDESLKEELKDGNQDGYWRNPLNYFNHEEFRDDSVFLFADYLPANVYEYEYLVRATTPGKFKYRPSRIWEMYFPETFGQTEGGWIEIKE